LNAADDTAMYASFLGPNFGVQLRVPSGWSVSPISNPSFPQVRRVLPTADASQPMALLFVDKPMRSTDFGAHFTNAVSVSQTGFEPIRFFDAALNPGNKNFWVAATNKGVFYSQDNGGSWTRSNMGGVFQDYAFSAVGYKTATNVFAADFSGNRYCSNNNGVSWISAGAPLRAGVNAIRNIGGTLYYLTDGAGIFREDGSC